MPNNNTTDHTIWHNDAAEIYEAVKDQRLEDIAEEFNDENPELDEDEIWDATYEDIRNSFDCEVDNLNIDTKGEIVLIGTIVRWDGPRDVYKQTGKYNIGESMKAAVNSFNGDNTFKIYVNGDRMYLSQTGHDNPVNPSIIEFRELTKDFDELERISNATLLENSIPLGDRCNKVYGW